MKEERISAIRERYQESFAKSCTEKALRAYLRKRRFAPCAQLVLWERRCAELLNVLFQEQGDSISVELQKKIVMSGEGIFMRMLAKNSQVANIEFEKLLIDLDDEELLGIYVSGVKTLSKDGVVYLLKNGSFKLVCSYMNSAVIYGKYEQALLFERMDIITKLSKSFMDENYYIFDVVNGDEALQLKLFETDNIPLLRQMCECVYLEARALMVLIAKKETNPQLFKEIAPFVTIAKSTMQNLSKDERVLVVNLMHDQCPEVAEHWDRIFSLILSGQMSYCPEQSNDNNDDESCVDNAYALMELLSVEDIYSFIYCGSFSISAQLAFVSRKNTELVRAYIQKHMFATDVIEFLLTSKETYRDLLSLIFEREACDVNAVVRLFYYSINHFDLFEDFVSHIELENNVLQTMVNFYPKYFLVYLKYHAVSDDIVACVIAKCDDELLTALINNSNQEIGKECWGSIVDSCSLKIVELFAWRYGVCNFDEETAYIFNERMKLKC